MKNIFFLFAMILLASCGVKKSEKSTASTMMESDATYTTVLKSEVTWEHLNPARGDKSPSAGTLWGDRKGDEPTGYLLKPKDGFLSPPHIHNVTYRGVVISGLLHNDDTNAADMWMPSGSFWTQPAGEVHVTGAKGDDALAYIEIESGPYLVWPKEKAFDNGERPVNVDKGNIVWIDADELKWIDHAENSKAQVAFLWGSLEEGELHGQLVKLPAGFKGKLIAEGDVFGGVIVQGAPNYNNPKEKTEKTLDAGSYFSSRGVNGMHHLAGSKETLIYVRTNGKVNVVAE